jgi:hypothetical protein
LCCFWCAQWMAAQWIAASRHLVPLRERSCPALVYTTACCPHNTAHTALAAQ